MEAVIIFIFYIIKINFILLPTIFLNLIYYIIYYQFYIFLIINKQYDISLQINYYIAEYLIIETDRNALHLIFLYVHTYIIKSPL